MSKIKVDVMYEGGARFYCTISHEYNSLEGVKIENVVKQLRESRPGVFYKKGITLVFY